MDPGFAATIIMGKTENIRYKTDIFRCDGERETTDLLIFMLFYKGICSGLARNHEEMYTLYLYV